LSEALSPKKADIIAQLRTQLNPLQGVRNALNGIAVDTAQGPQKLAFPNDILSFGAVHEFICKDAEEAAATGGFIAAVLGTLMKDGAATLWISTKRTVFPPGLKSFGIEPENIIFLDLLKTKDVLWAFEEALKCNGVAAVVGEIPELGFTTSRRLQLAVEQSGVMGFILRQNPRNLTTTACLTRWNIHSLPGELKDAMPGVGFPRWNATLLKIRNGKPGNWQVEWKAGKFRTIISPHTAIIRELRKTG
jgi:protein ImuA